MNQLTHLQAWRGLALIGVIALIGYSAMHFLAAGRDDTFIMLWAGQTLGQGSWFLNFNYATQEIASSIIGVLIAALSKGQSIGYALLIIKVFGLLSAIATLYLIWCKRDDIYSGVDGANWFAMAAVIATAASPVFMYWSFGGLETPHHALLILSFCILFVKSITKQQADSIDWLLLVTGVLLVLVRTEAFWLLFLAGFLVVFINRCSVVSSATFRALFVASVIFVLLLGVRYLFTGAIWPNPVYAKVGDFNTAIPAGLKYIFEYFASSPWAWAQGLAIVYGVFSLFKLCFLILKRQALGDRRLLIEAVIGGVVACHLMFVILSGGNWMEYFRFMAAIVPLMNILVFFMLAYVAQKFWQSRFVIGATVLIGLLSLTQIGRASDKYAANCSKPIGMSIALSGLEGLSKAVIQNNCAHSRDSRAIKPFIDEQLPKYLRKNNGHLTVASYQAGFFPYHLRLNYTVPEILFIDSAGLNELEVARLPGGKSSGGILFRDRIDIALLGEAGPLSQYFSTHPVNLVYLLDASPEVRSNFAKLGFERVWDVDGAVVFYRSDAH